MTIKKSVHLQYRWLLTLLLFTAQVTAQGNTTASPTTTFAVAPRSELPAFALYIIYAGVAVLIVTLSIIIYRRYFVTEKPNAYEDHNQVLIFDFRY